MAQKLNTALIQANLKWEDPQANRGFFSKEIKALSEDIDLIILPEMFTTGFSMNASKLAEKTDGLTLNWMREMTKLKDAAVTGSVIITENDNFYNRLFFVFPDGSYKIYDKRHTFTLAREDETYTAGKDRLIVDYRGWKICPLVCYDLRFPVFARNTEDYDLLLYVANWPSKRVFAWDTLLKARAIENMSYCIGVNRTGNDGDGYKYNGHTAAYDCLGKNLTELDLEKPFIKEISLEKKHLEETRGQLKFLQDRDEFTLK
ncbi:amidohydrolase [Salegentibacter salegens]|uniref:Omega-amidase YafV n=1 Tax=Salegentibacter salegens TaxID=143223 RepID=A0A1M7MQK9_9FLAO|nr:amidohydrolase [Salegentibacter salegens]PRX52571.1 putative amidohydrolase [Salegentibacter salegens]SHM93344.1 Predicted amidohydrolase [Salegentibacter salegens]